MHQISLETARETERMNQFAVYNHIEMVEVEPDHAIFRLNIRPESKNGYGMVHGGAIYAMADNATGFAAHTDAAMSPRPAPCTSSAISPKGKFARTPKYVTGDIPPALWPWTF